MRKSWNVRYYMMGIWWIWALFILHWMRVKRKLICRGQYRLFVLAPLSFGFDATSREGVSPKDVFFHSIQINS